MEPGYTLTLSLMLGATLFCVLGKTISHPGALLIRLKRGIQCLGVRHKIRTFVPSAGFRLWASGAERANCSNIYALIIGIDSYLHQPSLAGAVADANSVLELLTVDLGVPLSHISALRNSEATRAAIIKAFQSIQNDARIRQGDPILIYFAGHGGIGNTSDEGKGQTGPASRVQVIFPFDYGVDDGPKGKINCITDKAIAALLNNMAAVKGNNITVIFDSCHSASASRAQSSPLSKARNAPVKFAIPVDLDSHIISSATQGSLGSRHISLPLYTHQTSHIHLAACGSEEQAWEENGRGLFTAALLKAIRTYGVDKLSYHSLIMGLPSLNSQTPHCYGAFKSRTLFDGRVSSRKIAYIPAFYDVKARSVTLQAGTSSGVTKDSIWEVRENPTEGEQSILARMKAGKPGVSNTTLILEEDMWNEAFWARCKDERGMEGNGRLYARLIKSGPGDELKVWFSPEVDRMLFPGPKFDARDVQWQEHEVDYVAHEAMIGSDITVTSYYPTVGGKRWWSYRIPGLSRATYAEPEAEFHISNPIAKKLGISTLQQHKRIRRDQIEPVLFAAARWNMYLNYHNTTSTQSPISVEMFKIGERIKCDEEYSNDWKPVPSEERVNLTEMGVVDLEVHSRDLYAAQLRSSLYEPLYVRMFYFDTGNFSIDDLFGHSMSNGKADPVVPSYGDFVIGDGRKGGAPLSFELDPGQKSDLGYLKIFWSTDPLELDHLGQGSAFETINTGARGFVKKKTGACQTSTWGVEVLTIIQRAPSAPQV